MQNYDFFIRKSSLINFKLIKISDSPIENWSEKLIVKEGEIGEIVVKGDLVTQKYFRRPKDNALAKIRDNEDIRHRMGDLGWQDKKGRYWFCGRKNHQVTTSDGPMFTVPCEAVFNNHPAVFRSALVGIGPKGKQRPVICIELKKEHADGDLNALKARLLEKALENPMTEPIKDLLFHKSFPVDIRHNAKIFREKLASWAAGKIKNT